MLLQVRRVRCEASGVMVPKDKAIKRFIVRNIVDASAIRDIQDSSVFDGEHQQQQLLLCGVQQHGGRKPVQPVGMLQRRAGGRHINRAAAAVSAGPQH